MSMSLKHIVTYLCSTLLLLTITVQVSGQIGGSNYIYNKGASITIPAGVTLYIKDGQYRHNELTGSLPLIGLTGELIADSGLIFNITNNANVHKLFKLNLGAEFGIVKFQGGEIGGNSTPVFGNIELNSTNRLKLNTNIGVYRGFDINMGSVDLNANQVSLYENSIRGLFTGEIKNESETNYIFDNTGAGSVLTYFVRPFNKLTYPASNPPNTTFGNIGAIVGVGPTDYYRDVQITRTYDKTQSANNSFNTYFLIDVTGSALPNPTLTLNYLNRNKPIGSNPTKYQIFRDATNFGTGTYTPVLSKVGTKKVESVAIKSNPSNIIINVGKQRFVIGECATTPTINLKDSFSFCDNERPTLNADPNGENTPVLNFKYTWYYNGQAITGAINTTNSKHKIVRATGAYAVLVSDGSSCFNYHEFYVLVNPVPNATFNVPSILCEDRKITFTNTTSSLPSGSITKSYWDFNLDTRNVDTLSYVGKTDGIFTYSDSGTYKVQLIMETDSSCRDTSTISPVDLRKNPNSSITASTFERCANETFTFKNASTSSQDPILSSYWYIDGSSPLTKNNPNQLQDAQYNRIAPPGPKNRSETLMLITKSNKNCVDTVLKTIQVRPTPSAVPAIMINPARSPIKFCIDTLVSFQATSIKNTVAYNWDFGEAQTNTNNNSKRPNQNPTLIKYNTAGTYTAQLHLTSNLGCKDTFSISNIVVHPLPIPLFSITEDSVCFGTSIQLANSKQPSTTYNWNFGDASTSNSQGVSVSKSYATSGVFNIRLNAESQFGCKSDSTKLVRVKPMPSVSFTANDKCEDSIVTFSSAVISTPAGAPALTDTTNLWSFGEANTNALNTAQRSVNNPSITYSKNSGTGTYTPTYNVVAEKCTSTTATQVITIFPNPIAKFNHGDNCDDDLILFTNISTIDNPGINSYNWNMGDGSVALTHALPFNYDYVAQTSQNYTVNLRATSDKGCIHDTAFVVRNYALPQAIFLDSLSNQCQDSTSKFENLSVMTDKSNMTYQWLFDDGDTSTLKNPIHIYKTATAFNVKLTAYPTDVTNPCKSDTTNITVIYPLPKTSYTFSDNCVDDSIRFSNNTTITSPGSLTYKWSFIGGVPDTAIAANSFKYSYTVPATKTVILKATSDKGCPISDTQSVRFYPFVDANFDTLNASTCIFETSEFSNTSALASKETWIYSWDFDEANSGTQTSTLKNPTNKYLPITAGLGIDSVYRVKLLITPTDPTNVCKDSVEKFIFIHPLPDSSFNVTQDTFCLGTKIFLIKNITQNSHTYHWDLGDGSLDSNTTVSGHTYRFYGSYTPKLTAISEYGCVSSDTQNVYVKSMPDPTFIITRDTICIKDSVVFIDSSVVAADSYVWNFGDGSANDSARAKGDTIVRLYANANNYTVSRTAILKGCASTIKKTVAIEPDPITQFTLVRDNLNGKKIDITNNSYLTNGKNGSLNFDWSFGDGTKDSTTSNFFNHIYPSDRKYFVTLKATSNFGCYDSRRDSIVTLNTANSIFSLSRNSICKGDTFSFTNNSTNAQTYSWNFGDGSTSTSKTPNHTYSSSGKFLVQLIAKDANNYTDTSSQVVTIKAIPMSKFSSNNNICAKDQLVFTNNSVIQSTDTLQFKWSFGDGDTSLEKYPTHRYDTGSTYQAQLIAISASGCSDTMIKTVNIFSGPIAKFDTTNARACAGSLSSLTDQTIIASGESISSYLWRLQNVPGQPTTKNTSVTYNAAGRYNIELVVSSARGCKDSVTYGIVIDSVPILNFGGTQNTCGSTLLLDAKNPIATYSWSTSDTTKTITVSSSAKYKVTVTLPGISSCKTTDSVIVNLNTPVKPNLGPDLSACGNAVLDAKNPGSSYNWLWSGGGSSTKRILNILSSNTYFVTVTDQNSCIGLDTIVATITAVPLVTLGSDINVCAGYEVILDAGNAGKQFKWSNGTTNQKLINPVTGFYKVTVTDSATGCSEKDSINVSYNSSPSFTLGADKTVCGLQSILLNAGAFTNGNYLWSDSSIVQTLAINKTGNYWVKLTNNGNSCSRTDSINILINPLPNLTMTPSINSCAGNTTVLKPVTSNAANYTYSWNDSSTDSVLSPAVTGLYSVTVTDPTSSCMSIASSNVKINPSPKVDLGNDSSLCSGSSMLLSVGSSSYNTMWSNSSTSPAITVSSAGTYSVIATQNGCSTKDTISLTSTIRPVVNLGSNRSICSNDTLSIDAGNVGSTFNWSDNSTNQILKTTSSGFYSVTVTRSGCSSNGNVNVLSFIAPKINLGKNDTLCQGITAILNAKNPGALYNWNNASTAQVVQVATANTYKVTVTDQNNCTATDSIIITYITKPTVNLGGNINLCSGLKDTLDAGNPGLKYNWNTGDTTKKLIVMTGGAYRVTVSEGACSAQDQILASVKSIPSVNLGIDKIGCLGDSLTLASLNNYASGTAYSWSTIASSRSIKAGSTGKYTLTVTAANNCKNQDSININIKPVPVVNLASAITACGYTALDAGNLGATYAWNTNAVTQSIKAKQSGIYIVSVSVSSCTTKDTSVVTINSLPVVNLGSNVLACPNNGPVFNAGNFGKKYLWKNGDTLQTYTPTLSDTLWVRVTDNLGCAGTDTVVINFKAGTPVSLGNDIDSCHYQDILLDAQNPGGSSRFVWSTGKRTQTISIGRDGAYSVTVTDSKNCSSSDVINVKLKAVPIVNLGNDRDVCDSLTLDAQNIGSDYLWNNSTTNRRFLAQTAGTYWVSVKNSGSCIAADTVVLGIKATPTVNLGQDTTLCSGNVIRLNANNPGNTILWSNNTAGQSISVAALGTYWVKVTNSLDCSRTDSIKVSIGRTPIINLGPDTGFCINQELPLNAGNPGSTYIWGGPNNFSDTAQSSTISVAGKYYVQVTTEGGCVDADTLVLTAKTDTVYAYFLATSKAEIRDTVQFIDLSYPDIKSWNYDFGDFSTSTLQDPEHEYFVDGKYTVSLTVSNGSCQDSRTKEIVVSKRLKQDGFDPNAPESDRLIEPTQFIKSNLYPNPSQGSFRLSLELSKEDNIAIYFFDMRGTILHQELIKGVDAYVNDFHFDNLSAGMYFMQANLGRETKIFRVVITR